MKKIMKWVIGIAVIIMFSFFYAHIAKTHILYDNRVDTSKYMGTGVLSGKIEQKFVSEEDYLDGITIKCSIQGTPADSTVKISLKDDETGKIVAKSELKLKDIKNSKFNVFKFVCLLDLFARFRIYFCLQFHMLSFLYIPFLKNIQLFLLCFFLYLCIYFHLRRIFLVLLYLIMSSQI